MSWQAYVDTNLVGSGKVSRAAIIGLQGGIWAQSPGFDITPKEQQFIIDGFKTPENFTSQGVKLAAKKDMMDKYFVTSVRDLQNVRSVYGKRGADGVVIVKTKQAILVTVYDAPIQAAESTPIVEKLADYLISVGY